MRKISLIFLISSLFVLNIQSQDLKLWYEKPADEWMKALPIGNGRLGGVIYGRTDTEIVALNEITMWSGQYDENQNTSCGKENMKKIRQLFFDSDPINGNGKATDCFKSKSHSFGTHLPIGDLKINFGHYNRKINNYRRSLDLENAIASVSYDYNNVHYEREYICSNPDQVMIIHLKADKQSSINFDLSLDLLRDAEIKPSENGLEFTGKASFPNLGSGGVNFIGKIQVLIPNGSIFNETRCDNEQVLIVKEADEAKIILDIRTNYQNQFASNYQNQTYINDCNNSVKNALEKSFNQIREDHIRDYSNLFSRVELSLGSSEADALATDIRWKRLKEGITDPGLDALFFQYARYLLIACSRENSPLPANLQGLWNDNLACNMGWTCDYHLDINTQQNYWLSNSGNLHECNIPLFNYIKDLSVSGEKTAYEVYESPGWVVHTVSNAWGYTGIGEGMAWSMFPASTAWISSHLWTHYLYTQDKDFLRNEAYPTLKSAARFFLDYMAVNPYNGYLMTGPTNSPENTFKFNGWELAMSMMTTADRVLIHELFTYCINSSVILETDEEFRTSLEQALAKFPPIKIGKNGGIQEWFEDYEDAHPNHRHSTHLLSLYPYAQITLDKTPELAKAAQITIENKLNAEGWEDVEWSRANAVCFYARLKKAETAYTNYHSLLKDLTRENLLTISPAGIAGAPWDIFIFDGNEAGASAVVEMLVQAHEGYIEFLPALPDVWKNGYIKGICIPDGAEVDMEWSNGVLTKATLKATSDNSFTIKVPVKNTFETKELKKGDTWEII